MSAESAYIHNAVTGKFYEVEYVKSQPYAEEVLHVFLIFVNNVVKRNINVVCLH